MNFRLHVESFNAGSISARAEVSSPVCTTRAGSFSPAKRSEILHVIAMKSQPGLRSPKFCVHVVKGTEEKPVIMRCAVLYMTCQKQSGGRQEGEKASTLKFKKTTETIRFRWNRDDKIENLIRCLANYKPQMDYQNIGFNGDKVKQYEAVREAMARIYEEPSFFGPPFITPTPDKEVDQEERAKALVFTPFFA